jgi:hypothetical protein
MHLDVRLPIGLLFCVLGALLLIFGAVSDAALYQRSLDINVNLLWGGVLLGFGIIMLILGRRSLKNLGAAPASGDAGTPPGRAH